jgi:hypothetical protein
LTIDPLNFYEVSNDCMEDSPYLTRTATTVMRSISYVSSSESDEKNKSASEADASEADASDNDSLTITP